MSAPLLIVSGPPGSGKTTVAAALAARFPKSAHLLGDHFFRYIVGGWLDPSLPESDEQNRAVISISARAAAGYAQAGYTTVLDGIYGPWFLDLATEAAGEVALHYVVLRADLDTCLDRALGRVGSNEPNPLDGPRRREAADLERVVRTMHEHFDELAQFERFVVDTTTSTPGQVSDQVIARLDAGELALG